MKILYVATISNTINAFLIPHIKMLIEEGHQVDVAFNIVQEVSTDILELNCRVYNLDFSRSPLNKNNIIAYKKLKEIIVREQYDIVHTHTPVASVCVRLACKNLESVKIIYTAHGFHFYKGASIKNWLIYYPIEKWLSAYTDVLVTINKEDYNRAKNSFRAKKVEYIPGIGLDIDTFNASLINRQEKRKELGIIDGAFTLLSVGELNDNKNHEIIIRALKVLDNPEIIYIICGTGPKKDYLTTLIKKLNLEKQVKLLGFNKNISDIYKISDVFTFPSKREGLPVSIMEAMASGLPIICSDIRGNNDLVVNNQGGYLLKENKVELYANKIKKLLEDEEKRCEMSEYNKIKVEKFGLEKVKGHMDKLYCE